MLSIGNVSVQLRLLCSCPMWRGGTSLGLFWGVCVQSGSWRVDVAVLDVLLLTCSLSLGGAALDQILPLVQVKIKMNSEFCSCSVLLLLAARREHPCPFSCPGRKTWIPNPFNLSGDPTLPLPKYFPAAAQAASPSPGL